MINKTLRIILGLTFLPERVRRWLPWITVVAGLTAGTGVSAQSVQAVLPEVVKEHLSSMNT